MQSRKIFQWIFIFGILSSYSWFVLTSLGEGMSVEAAYAKTISSNPAFENASTFLVIEDRKRNALERVLARLRLRADRERELCSISQEDFANLSRNLNLQAEKLNVKGRTVTIAAVDRSALREEIRNRIHCKRLQILENIILILTAHLS